jgi:hypothetical protein
MAEARSYGWADRLERVARLVPGIGRYQDRDGLRETDKRVRLHLAEALVTAGRALERAQERLVEAKRLDRLVALDRLGKRLTTAADRIRTASYGFGGVFDLHKVRESELSSLHRYDLRLLEQVPSLDTRLEAVAAAVTADTGFPEAVAAAEALMDDFTRALDEREHVARRL